MTKRIKKEWQRAVKKRKLAEQKAVREMTMRLIYGYTTSKAN